MGQSAVYETQDVAELGAKNHLGPPSAKCEICAQLLAIIHGQNGDNITLRDVPLLTSGGLCNVHEGFFQWLQKLSMGKYVSLEGNREQNYNADSHVCIKRTQVDKINLQGTQGCNVNGEVLIARLGDREPITEGIARLVDRNWIDVELIKQWKKTCELEHGEGCLLSHHGHLPRPSLPWLIDTVDHCLVEGGHKATYVALSYVWGGLDVFKTTREILPALLQPGALHHQERLLPRTISDAMSVVRLLGERYLWVDALCIVQDDEKIRHSLVNDMGAVYANATLTIVAADSSDADSGLRGLRGLSGPRNNPCIFEWPDGTRLNWPGTGGLSCSVWNERGWTFQEYLFSRRRLIFVAESVRWECRTECSWEEYTLKGALPTPEVCSEYDTDVCNIRKTPAIVSLAFPDMVSFATLVNAFNDRQLTFEDDAMDAFSGVATALAQSFIGGFLWGVPVMFLDLALVWRAFPTEQSPTDAEHHRRWNPRHVDGNNKNAPTWSWISWQGRIGGASVWRNEDWLLFSRDEWFYNVDPIRRIVPCIRWSIRQAKDSEVSLNIPYQNEWHALKMRYAVSDPPSPPSGWKRWPINLDFENPQFSLLFGIEMQAQGAERATTLDIDNDKYPPRYYYTHDSIKSIKFAYPIPSREEVGCGSLPQPADNSNGRYLCGSTRRAFFGLNILEADDYYHSSHDIIDLESPGVKAGRLWPDKAFSDASVRLVELVAVSLKYCAENRKRWEQPFGGEIPQLYNVLWIEWLDGVAYRKGVGEVKRAVWETRAVESIELILG